MMKKDFTEPEMPKQDPRKKHPKAHPMYCGSSVYNVFFNKLKANFQEIISRMGNSS